jgi:DNA-directed RNA polymerase specialized sigma24 family protein
VNACIDEIRRLRRRRLDVDVADLSNPQPSPTPRRRSPTATKLDAASAGSSPRSGRSSCLHHYLDLPLPEVAATLRIPLGTTKSRLYRGLRQMRAALDADARPGPDDP